MSCLSYPCTIIAGNILGGCYIYTNDLLALEAATPFKVSLPSDCCLINSPLKANVWERMLSTHPDKQYANFIVGGVSSGFRIGCQASKDRLQSSSRNMSAAYANPAVVDKYIMEEVAHGRLVQVQPPLSSSIHISRMGVIPKKHQPGKWRLIVDLSSPTGASINDFVDPGLCSLSYASVEDAAAFVFRAGKGALLAKLDIKSAYRNVPVHPEDHHLLGICWQGKTFVDTCLPFGLRSAPKVFNATADALEWIIVNQGGSLVEFILHYLDDFLFGGRPESDSYSKTLDLALHLCHEVGFPVISEKVVGPSTVIDFLGFIIDTLAMEFRLPDEKLS